MKLALTLVCFLLLVAGCSKRQEQAVDKNQFLTHAATNFFETLPETLVTVNGVSLSRDEALAELDARAEALRNKLQEGDIEAAKIELLPKLVGAFVTRTLLEQEADRRQIVVSEAELSNTLARIEQQIGTDVNVFMEQSPMGPERMRAEVLKGLRVERMLRQALGDKIQVDEADVDAFIEANRESLTHPETGELMPREAIERLVRKQAHDRAMKAFIEQLRQQADLSMAPAFQ